MMWSHPQVTAVNSDSLGQGSPRASAVWWPAQRAVLPHPCSSSSRFGPGRWAQGPEIVSSACQLGLPPESLPSGLGWAGVAGEQRDSPQWKRKVTPVEAAGSWCVEKDLEAHREVAKLHHHGRVVGGLLPQPWIPG